MNASYQANRCSLRIKTENNMRIGAVDHLSDGSQDDGVILLKPISSSQSQWRWSPLFPDTGAMFELLDRKIPA